MLVPAKGYVVPDRKQTIKMFSAADVEGAEIHFTTDGSEPSLQSARYVEPIALTQPMTLKARLFCGAGGGDTARGEYQAMPVAPPAPDVPLAEVKALKATVGVPGTTIGLNRSWSGKPLSVAGKGFAAGIGTCARSDLVYRSEPTFRRFVAVVGVDDAMRDYPQASVVFRVYVDAREGDQAAQAIAGETLLTQTDVMRSGDMGFIDVAIPDNARTIRLEVDDAGDGIDCDHADWANAGFLTQPPQSPEKKEKS
jgi:hypothetical protein